MLGFAEGPPKRPKPQEESKPQEPPRVPNISWFVRVRVLNFPPITHRKILAPSSTQGHRRLQAAVEAGSTYGNGLFGFRRVGQCRIDRVRTNGFRIESVCPRYSGSGVEGSGGLAAKRVAFGIWSFRLRDACHNLNPGSWG